MAGQGPSRRELLEGLSLASAASLFKGFSRWGYALAEGSPQHGHPPSIHPRVHSQYKPQFFSGDEYLTVEVLSELILPRTRGPAGKVNAGAREAGVAEFIDFMVFSDSSLQAPFREGLMWLDHASVPATTFVSLSTEKQSEILERLAYKTKQRENEEIGQQFFRTFRKYTVTGFYTTRLGLESLDYPGLTFYATSPGCTHEGNPEHVGL